MAVYMPTTLAEMYARDVWHLGEPMCKNIYDVCSSCACEKVDSDLRLDGRLRRVLRFLLLLSRLSIDMAGKMTITEM